MSSPDVSPRIDHEQRSGLTVIRIHNPRRANALTGEMLRDLASLLNDEALARSHAVLLAGAGERHFSAGLDLAAVSLAQRVDYLKTHATALFEVSEAIADCRRPVIGVLNGATFGGGLELALACDWRIAWRGARIGMPAARLGVVYDTAGLRRAVGLLGAARVRRLFLTARPVDAVEGHRLGLVDQLADDHDHLWTLARQAGDDIGACSPTAVAGMRAIIRAIETGEPTARNVERIGAHWRERAYEGADLREGLRAFAEGRPARFSLGDPPA